MIELLVDILWAFGAFLMILPFGIAITALLGFIVGKCLDKYLKEEK